MNFDLKTVEVSEISDKIEDPLLQKQQSDIERMRQNALSCGSDSNLAQSSLRNITVLRIYHQMSRIIRYTEMMDKIEDKLYQSIDHYIENAPIESNTTWMTLLNIQEKLQKNMVDSMKLLEPYLDIADFAQFEVSQQEASTETISLDAGKREKLRNSAKSVLKELSAG